ncbi:MAG: hypothetical protein IJN63_10865 [Clostridia bacterium]|nr:hypothetical protein [Clostridia bacterium]
MKKELSVDEIVEMHVKSDLIIDECMKTLNKRSTLINNREVKKLNKLIQSYKDDKETAKQVYEKLFAHSNSRVRSHAAVECLRIGIFEEVAVKTLEEIELQTGITAHGARWALKLWRGEIKGRQFERY